MGMDEIQDHVNELGVRLTDVEAQLPAFTESLKTMNTLLETMGSNHDGVIGAVFGALIAGGAAWLVYRRQNKHAVAVYEIERLETFIEKLEKLSEEVRDIFEYFGGTDLNDKNNFGIGYTREKYPEFEKAFAIAIAHDFEKLHQIEYMELNLAFKEAQKAFREFSEKLMLFDAARNHNKDVHEAMMGFENARSKLSTYERVMNETFNKVRVQVSNAILRQKKNL